MALLINVRHLASFTSPHRPTVGVGCNLPERTESSATLVSTDSTTQGQDDRSSDKSSASYQNPVFEDSPTDTDWCKNSSDTKERDSPRKLDGTKVRDSVVQIYQDGQFSKDSDDKTSDALAPKGSSPTQLPQHIPPVRRKSSSNGTNGFAKTRDDGPTSGGLKKNVDEDESLLAICLQVFFPFLVAGIGTCGAGLLLDEVKSWDAFTAVTEIYILVPTLLGLKGNLEMTLASRVSTQVNLDKLDSWKERWYMCWGNMTLLQCQATVLSFLSSCFATVMRSVRENSFDLNRALLLGASALFTASFASLLLGAVTLAVVLASHKFRVNPDNIATPIAASLGDVTTLGILAAIASYLYNVRADVVPSSVCVGVILLSLPIWVFFTYRNSYVKRVLFFGWTPVVVAVIITSVGGYILEFSVKRFSGISIFQPVINGVAGNLVAVQASRISTYFHKNCTPGSLPPDGSGLCISPFSAFFGKTAHSRVARVLLTMVIPGHLLFGYGITLISGDPILTPTFLPIYLASAVLQVGTLLYIAQCLIHVLWRWKIDPDNWAIPLLTALGDLSGMAALALAFLIHEYVT